MHVGQRGAHIPMRTLRAQRAERASVARPKPRAGQRHGHGAVNPQSSNRRKLVLIDSGNGIALFESSKGAVGRTLTKSRGRDVQSKDIDIV